MLPPLVTAEDLQNELPSDWQAGDAARVEAAIRNASALVRDEVKPVTWVVDGVVTDLPEIVRTITLEVARRSLNRSFVYGAEGQAVQEVGGLYLKADERARLLAAVELPPAPTFGSARLSSPPLFGYTA